MTRHNWRKIWREYLEIYCNVNRIDISEGMINFRDDRHKFVRRIIRRIVERNTKGEK